ncbi:hypothetical protein ACOQFL_10530 [Actinopolyspora sp. H202]|uniref:hypothetical protein n=1 Tax=Actinopolyspora sp. H202 TaxID=1500456 RepID=UPI003EE55249
MGLDSPLPRSLEARATWCHPDEAIRWVFAQRSVRYDVAGLDPTGSPLPGWGKRLGQGLKQAAGSAGMAVLGAGLSIATGEIPGRDNGTNGPAPSVPDFPNVTVFGAEPESEAARLLSQQELARLMGNDSINLDKLAGDWILTSRRLALLVPEGGFTQRSGATGLVSGAVSWASKNVRKYGDNEASKPLEPNTLTSFLEIPRSSITGFDTADRSAGSEENTRTERCFRITLRDGSGFDLHKPDPAVQQLTEMTS